MTDIKTFKCARCGEVKPVQTEGGTGYAENEEGKRFCYSCCAEIDKEHMRERGKITLYLTGGQRGLLWELPQVSNWPGTLSFPVKKKRTGRHNIAGKRYDVWFNGPDGHVWHGVTYGENTQLCHCRRTKELTE